MSDEMERFIEQMVNKIEQITESLDGTIAQINKIEESVKELNKGFEKETASLNENIRLIIEALKQFRVQSNSSISELAKEINQTVQDIWDEKKIQSYFEDAKQSVDRIKDAEKVVSDNLYYAQLLTIVKNISTYLQKIKK
jgi:phage-related protein